MKRTILLVDDDEDEFELFIQALHGTPFSCDCIFSRSAKQALSLLNYTVPHFIFLDYNMPQMNGLECLREIKKMENLQDVMIILYSNSISDKVFENAIASGATFCITKPDRLSGMSEMLRRILAMQWQFK